VKVVNKAWVLWLSILCFYSAKAQQNEPPLERSISIIIANEPLDEVLKRISQQGNFSFSYSSKAFDSKKKISLSVTNKTVRETIELIFEGAVQYKQKNNYIIITKAPVDEVVVSGYVVDEATGKRLKEVSIYDPVSLRSAITDEYGFFELPVEKASAEQLRLAIKKNNYTDTLVVVPAKRSSFQNISLNIDKDKWRAFADSVDSKMNRLWTWTKRSVASINLRNIRDTLHRTWQVSLVPFVGSNHALSGNVVNDYSFNILGGFSAGTSIMEIGGLFNIDAGDVQYGQAAGLFNVNAGKTKGVQFAGLANVGMDSVDAIQFAGLINSNLGSSRGVQMAGLANVAMGSYEGAQAAGLFNFTLRDVEGTQVAGLFNTAIGDMKGGQVASLFNINGGTIRGSQVAGLINMANTVEGTQIALLNIADSIKGVPVGFLSFVNRGYHTIEVSADEVFPVHVAFRTGVRKFYNIFTAGFLPESADSVTWSFGYGIGTLPRLSKKFSLNIDLTANQLMKGNVEKLNMLNKLYVGIDYRLFKKFSITAGGSLTVRVYDRGFNRHPDLFYAYEPELLMDDSKHRNGVQMWWGAKLGLRFL
jgi:hypothetical protein